MKGKLFFFRGGGGGGGDFCWREKLPGHVDKLYTVSCNCCN